MQSTSLAAGRVLTGLAAGALTGFMVALALASMPALFIANDSGGGLGGAMMALFFVAAPVGVILGAAVGAYMAHRGALRYACIGMLVSLVAGPMIAAAAERRAMGAVPIAADGCLNALRSTESGPGESMVMVFERRCPGQPPTIEVSILPKGSAVDETARGNALALDASAEAAGGRVHVYTAPVPQSDSVVTLTYSSHARVLRQQEKVGPVRLHLLPDSVLSPDRQMQMVGTGPAAQLCTILPFDRIRSARLHAIAFQRDCGTSRTLNVSLFEGSEDVTPADSGNVLVLDFPRGPDSLRAMTMHEGTTADLEIVYAESFTVLYRQGRVGRLVAHAAPYGKAPVPVDATGRPLATVADPCRNEERQGVWSRHWRLSIFTRRCEGQAPTIEATIVRPPQVVDPAAPGNTFVLDASTETPDDSVLLRLVWADDSTVTIAYDARAPFIRKSSRRNGIGVRYFASSRDEMRLGPQQLLEAWSAAKRRR